MNRRQQLQRLARDLKNRIEWESEGISLPGAIPGTEADHEQVIATRNAAKNRAIAKLSQPKPTPKPKPKPKPSQAPTRPAPVASRPEPVASRPEPVASPAPNLAPQPIKTAQPDRPKTKAPKPPPRKPAPAPQLGNDVPLWKEFGSRPRPTYGGSPVAELEHAWNDGDELSNADKLSKLRELMGDCERCSLCTERSHIVFGEGSPTARLMFIGEAPGYHEDQQGRPFVGKSGQLLGRMIEAMGFAREDVYITNIIKCRPPNNRDPEPNEVRSCGPFVLQQVDAVNPDIIVTLGRFAATALLDHDANQGNIRGQWQEYNGKPVMPTYHPSHLLRSPDAKRTTWQDLQLVMQRLANPE